MVEAQVDKTTAGGWADLRIYLRQQPVMLALLAVLAVFFFLAVTGLSRAYHAQRESLGNRWFTRGVADLRAGRFDSAVTEFRAALLYSRDDYNYQLNLAEALIGLKRTGEASAYLANLWERQPEDGLVNLELARIAVQKRTDRTGAPLLPQCDLRCVAQRSGGQAARSAAGVDRIPAHHRSKGASAVGVDRAGGECRRRPGPTGTGRRFVSASARLRACARHLSTGFKRRARQPRGACGSGMGGISTRALSSRGALSASGSGRQLQ